MTFNPSDNHWTLNGYKERVTKEQLQEVLLERPDPIKQGKVHEWKHQKVGPGVYEIWMEEKTDLTAVN